MIETTDEDTRFVIIGGIEGFTLNHECAFRRFSTLCEVLEELCRGWGREVMGGGESLSGGGVDMRSLKYWSNHVELQYVVPLGNKGRNEMKVFLTYLPKDYVPN